MINTIGVGEAAQGAWMSVMSILSILAIPATLVEYYFTKERVTEESIAAGTNTKENTVSLLQQMKVCFSDPYWLIIIGYENDPASIGHILRKVAQEIGGSL